MDGYGQYVDLIERVGLRSAIISIANQYRIDLGAQLGAPGSDDRVQSLAKFESIRGRMRVSFASRANRFTVTMDSGRGYVWASGSTADLFEVVGAMGHWRRGAKLEQLSEKFPFMEFDRLSKAYEDGNPVETQWDIVIGGGEFIGYRDLLLALHADPGLRTMFPFFSHWTLRMAKDCYDAQAGEILIKPSADVGYVIWSSAAPEQRKELRRLGDVVREAARMLGDI
ncbi:DUF6193 family natural product biosynthesis protein [Streptomyces sp. NPDC001822]|uniref:DUF6193 family natural product biosynthesis protein n=1 Tax=Streptomyces sp. NPDC001822 TaxID=3364614 RepID=UPI0036B81785